MLLPNSLSSGLLMNAGHRSRHRRLRRSSVETHPPVGGPPCVAQRASWASLLTCSGIGFLWGPALRAGPKHPCPTISGRGPVADFAVGFGERVCFVRYSSLTARTTLLSEPWTEASERPRSKLPPRSVAGLFTAFERLPRPWFLLHSDRPFNGIRCRGGSSCRHKPDWFRSLRLRGSRWSYRVRHRPLRHHRVYRRRHEIVITNCN
jgi:hypothetical protein